MISVELTSVTNESLPANGALLPGGGGGGGGSGGGSLGSGGGSLGSGGGSVGGAVEPSGRTMSDHELSVPSLPNDQSWIHSCQVPNVLSPSKADSTSSGT